MREKQCPYCQRFLTLNPRVRKRRKTCGHPSCQKALNRENSARWKQEHPDSCRPDYPRVKLWLDRHPSYLRHYRETHPAYVENNRQAQRLRDRRKKLHLDIQAKIKRQAPEIIDQLWNLPHLDIRNERGLQPLEITLLFSTFPCLDMQNSLDKNLGLKDNGLIAPGGQFHGHQKTPLSGPSSKDRRLLQLDRSPLCHRRVPP